MSKLYLADKIQTDSFVDGSGIRAVIWFQGCSHNCKGCHNPNTHTFNTGIETSTEEIKKEIDKLENQSGITFSGGDPMFQPEALLDLLIYSKEKGLNTWCFTGFLYENLLKMSQENPIYLEILKNTDVLVDGPFILEKKSFSHKFRGSSNQRLIDIKKSLIENKVVLYEN